MLRTGSSCFSSLKYLANPFQSTLFARCNSSHSRIEKPIISQSLFSFSQLSTHHGPWVGIKACARYFLTNFYFSPNNSPSKTERCLLFSLKSSFPSRNIQDFVFPSSPIFLCQSLLYRAWSKINLKVHDVMKCLNKNLITHFVWYLRKKKSYDIETLFIDRVLNKEHFSGRFMLKMCTKS